MKARRLAGERKVVGDDAFVEIAIWEVPSPVEGSAHRFKYSLALVVGERCVLRYDNERGKGDHRHWHGNESSYRFSGLSGLIVDFWKDVEAYLDEHRHLQRPHE